MPYSDTVVLYERLIEIANQLLVSIHENSDDQILMNLLEQHQKVMAELKRVKIENDPKTRDLIQRAVQKVNEVMEQIRIKRDGLAEQLMLSKSRKRAFDAYHKI